MVRLVVLLLLAVSVASCANFTKAISGDPEDEEFFAGCRNYFFQARWRGQAVPYCPENEGLVLLPPTYPPGLVLFGYSPQPVHIQFLRELIEKLVEDQGRPQVGILIPRFENMEAYRLFSKYLEPPYSDFVRFIPVPAEDALWTQDYFEVAVSTISGRGTLIDLPYVSRLEESIPAAMALNCQMGLVTQEPLPKPKDYPGHGDFGGNIEPFPGNLIVAGNNLTATTQKALEVNLSQDILTVNTAWGEPGLADELYSVLPLRQVDKESCEFGITYASPKRALELIKAEGGKQTDFALSPPVPEGKDSIPVVSREDFSPCIELIARDEIAKAKPQLRKKCSEFVRANETYAEIIDGGLGEIIESVKKRTSCNEIQPIALPLLFAPEKIRAKYGLWDDHAVSV
ncbi:MAG: hypothetical protein KDD43_02190, partial [Bdellovibrionales bacterium]|nr:hypothetical protein [Bdellovibrionales bacterium]